MSGGQTFYGSTRTLAIEGAFMESTSFSAAGGKMPEIGQVGLLTLRYKCGMNEARILTKCQILNLLGTGVGISIRYSELSSADQRTMGRIVASGRANLDDE